jgi:hypothetical protein
MQGATLLRDSFLVELSNIVSPALRLLVDGKAERWNAFDVSVLRWCPSPFIFMEFRQVKAWFLCSSSPQVDSGRVFKLLVEL